MSDTQAILAANQAFYRAFEQKNLEAMRLVWSQGENAVCIHPGRPPLKSWEQIRLSWDQIFKNTEAIKVEFGVVTTEVSGNLGYAVLLVKLIQNIEGRRVEAQLMATNMFENIAGTWKLILHHGSPIMPARPPGQQPPGPQSPGL